MKSSMTRWMMFAGCAAFLAATPKGSAAASTTAQPSKTSHSGTSHVLRVCADPGYLPYSNRAGEGFENKIAELVAHAMGRKLEYTWASYRAHGGFSNFLALNLDARKCDVIMNLPAGDNEELATKPYYRSSYVFVTRKDKHLHIRSMRSVSMHSVKIGFEAETTPETAVKILGLIRNAVVFHVAGNPAASPRELLQAVQDGKVGVMVTWEPAIGAFMKDYPDLQLRRVPSEEYGPGLPAVHYSYAMSMGVRKGDTALRAALDKVIATHKAEIAATLAKFNVGLMPNPRHYNYSNG
ncbi:MAG TPA: transporter substrate-binding domain-containing protein [Acidiphilium sp.]|uniref:transporter substrate-binding domain-containing protein n=1 Tax=unclassified Acidiphilium TaxID=2617493 RepID=UPI000BCEAA40|nr:MULTISPECIES: transporter substrate-binding domain-containing protein [unclassified Acidiphilium]OYV56616.1 MAG: ABC transporter substrate-binding protein [Acidiphilium sp. 20-67-58]OYV86462.1 MAG: ABC transporter substrate-binding protein [Acidiphilium sp. 21-68-69]HQT62259.1 transporter substrate-binding domain-containing protein [Acidiphilium sp.]HQU11164.1 transporter substrate-binding domain-containing protein [Acidiphilium sp.]